VTYSGHNLGDASPAPATAVNGVLAVTGSVPVSVPLIPAQQQRFFQARPVLRRVVFVVGYETLSVLFTVGVLSALLGHGGGASTLTAVLVSTVATGWNYLWNTIFEAMERRRGATGRGAGSRAVHAIGYEGGVLLLTIPIVAIMLGVNLLEALAIEAGLLVFFLVFTVVYTWVFDRLFGLPASVAS
jgi:uncharacterized membrane protein